MVDCQAYLPDFTLAETICAVAARKVSFLYSPFFSIGCSVVGPVLGTYWYIYIYIFFFLNTHMSHMYVYIHVCIMYDHLVLVLSAFGWIFPSHPKGSSLLKGYWALQKRAILGGAFKHFTPEDERLEPTAITHEKKGKWSEPNLHEDMFQPLIFRDVFFLFTPTIATCFHPYLPGDMFFPIWRLAHIFFINGWC